MEEALLGKIAVIAVPTKRLLFQCDKILKDEILLKKDSAEASNIKIYTLMYETMPLHEDIRDLFIDEEYVKKEAPKDLPGCIHLVIHNYFRLSIVQLYRTIYFI